MSIRVKVLLVRDAVIVPKLSLVCTTTSELKYRIHVDILVPRICETKAISWVWCSSNNRNVVGITLSFSSR